MSNAGFTSIAAIGLGRMGLGIAVAHALAGVGTTLIDLKPRDAAEFQTRRDAVLTELVRTLDTLAELGLSTENGAALADLVVVVPEPDADAVLADADLVYEAVPETREAKTDALARTSAAASRAVIASTTSSMLAEDLALLVDRPERFVNVHWLNPAYIAPLVEVSHHGRTDPQIVERLCNHLESSGKTPVTLASSPGYIVPRLQALIMNEAARMVQEGVATPEEIDRATRYGLGHRFAALGVLEFIDFGGADILQRASDQMAGTIDAARYQCPEIVERLIEDGEEGLRDGRGFFDFPEAGRSAYRASVLQRTAAMATMLRELPEPGLESSERFRRAG